MPTDRVRTIGGIPMTNLFYLIAVSGGIIAYKSWIGLRTESYNQRNRNMNLYSFFVGLVLMAVFGYITFYIDCWMHGIIE